MLNPLIKLFAPIQPKSIAEPQVVYRGTYLQILNQLKEDNYLLLNEWEFGEKVFWFAYNKHEGHMRRGNYEPYFSHCLRVAMKSISYISNTRFDTLAMRRRLWICGLLHDVLEDTDCLPRDLYSFGIADRDVYVLGLLTRDAAMSYDGYIQRITNSNDVAAIVSKLADGSDNIEYNPFTGLDGRFQEHCLRYHGTRTKLIAALERIVRP